MLYRIGSRLIAQVIWFNYAGRLVYITLLIYILYSIVSKPYVQALLFKYHPLNLKALHISTLKHYQASEANGHRRLCV